MVKVLTLVILLGGATLTACGTDGARGRAPASNDPAAAASDPSDAGTQHLDAEQVPAELRHLVPMAERWGIGDDVDRNAKVDRATSVERKELQTAVEPHNAGITAWLDSFGQGQMSDEAAAFMYMQLALTEMQAGPPR
jgi:nucleotidyltransferase/DNA polymerase involved in DNA repair